VVRAETIHKELVESWAVGSQLVQSGSCSKIRDSQRGRADVNTETEGLWR
jgi:hypothetical protein